MKGQKSSSFAMVLTSCSSSSLVSDVSIMYKSSTSRPTFAPNAVYPFKKSVQCDPTVINP